MTKIAFKAGVKTDGKTRQPDIGAEYYPLITSGSVAYNSDYTECICIIEPIDFDMVSSAMKQYGMAIIQESEYAETEKEFKGFAKSMQDVHIEFGAV